MPYSPSNASAGRQERFWDLSADWADDDGNRWLVQFDLESDFVPRIRQLRVSPLSGDAELTQTLLRSIPIERLLRESLQLSAPADPQFIPSGVGPRRGRAGLTSDDLDSVADVYLQALRRRQPVQAAVAAQMRISRSAAAKRIMAARSRGLLPPAERLGPRHGRTATPGAPK